MIRDRLAPINRPRLTAPVMRYLPVANVERSLAFYRDVLGFVVNEGDRTDYGMPSIAEVISGPARIQFIHPEANECRDVAGPKIVFFQTDDVKKMRGAIAELGGEPGSIERVNWIEMEMFQINDPDGHLLWFGEPFDDPENPDRPAKGGQALQALPELPFNNVPAALEHYRDVLGFHVNYAQHDLAVMDRDKVTVVLIARTDKYAGIGSCYIYVKDADALYSELLEKGANILGEPISLPWGLRQFHMVDPEGNRITFGQPFE